MFIFCWKLVRFAKFRNIYEEYIYKKFGLGLGLDLFPELIRKLEQQK